MSNLYRAIGKSMLSRYAVYICNVFSLMVLTRMFNPEIFGVVAAVQTIVILFQMIAEGGVSPAIINLNELNEKDRDGIFGLSLSLAIIIGLVMLLLGPSLATFYGMPEVRQIVPYVAVALLGNTAAVFPLALLQREQRFRRIAEAGIVAELGGLTAAYVAHFRIPALHAYAIYFPVKGMLNFLVNWLHSQETEFGRPAFGRRFSAIKPLLRATGFQLGFNSVNYFSRNLDNILVGKYIGAGPLGIYDRSYQLMRYPLMLLAFAMAPAIQPALRDITHNRAAVIQILRDLAFKLSIAGALAGISIFFLAKYIVLVAFGERWLAVVPVVKLLALIIPVQTVYVIQGSFFQAFNQTHLLFWCGVLAALINVTAIVYGVYRGSIEALCWGLFISYHIAFLQTYYTLHKKILGGGYAKFLISVWPLGAALAIMLSAIF
ncbi:MAG: oligosaccharide flippase family protein [Microlunatus sp.]